MEQSSSYEVEEEELNMTGQTVRLMSASALVVAGVKVWADDDRSNPTMLLPIQADLGGGAKDVTGRRRRRRKRRSELAASRILSRNPDEKFCTLR
jgi:hypothetical protein